MKTILNCILNKEYIKKCAVNGRYKIEDMSYDKFIQGYIQVYKNSLYSKD